MPGENNLHIVVFPWLAFGHILPFLELSKCLAKRGHHISFISTPRNIQRLPKIPSEISHLLNFIHFPLPKVEGLPDSAEATSDVSPERVEYLKMAFDGLELPFRQFIKVAAPKQADWIIHDFAQHWIPQIAMETNVPCICFSIVSAASNVFFCSALSKLGESALRATPEQFLVPPPWVPFPSKLAFRGIHDARKLVDFAFMPNVSGVSDMHRFRSVIKSCDAIIVRSSMEFEPEWLRLLPQIHKKPVIPIGLLLARPPPDQDNQKEEGDNHKIIEWLDQRGSRSVVYIAFGSEAVLSDEQTHELALGLELAKVPFVWALRWPESMLPVGFEERSRDFGIIAKGWVPQLDILGHESVGGFMTHVGWSSVLEALQFRHPLIMLPIFIDQGLIARLMEDRGIGIEVERDNEDGSFTKDAVAKVLKLIMLEEEGENSWRRKAKDVMRQAYTDEDCQEKYIDEFLQYLLNHSLISYQ